MCMSRLHRVLREPVGRGRRRRGRRRDGPPRLVARPRRAPAGTRGVARRPQRVRHRPGRRGRGGSGGGGTPVSRGHRRWTRTGAPAVTARTTPRPDDGGIPRTAPGRSTKSPLAGVAVAGITALISGVSVFVNSYGVHSISAPAVYTTAKNLVATLVLAGCLAAARSVSRRRVGSSAARFVTVAAGPGVAGRPGRHPGAQGARPVGGPGLRRRSGWGDRLRPLLRRPGRHHGHPGRFLAGHAGAVGGRRRLPLPARTCDLVECHRHRRPHRRRDRHRRWRRARGRRPGRAARPRRHRSLGRGGRGGQAPVARHRPGVGRPGPHGCRRRGSPRLSGRHGRPARPGLPRDRPDQMGSGHGSPTGRLRRHVDDGPGPGPGRRRHVGPGGQCRGHGAPAGRGRDHLSGPAGPRTGSRRRRGVVGVLGQPPSPGSTPPAAPSADDAPAHPRHGVRDARRLPSPAASYSPRTGGSLPVPSCSPVTPIPPMPSVTAGPGIPPPSSGWPPKAVPWTI